jgi:hypothetical protein
MPETSAKRVSWPSSDAYYGRDWNAKRLAGALYRAIFGAFQQNQFSMCPDIGNFSHFGTAWTAIHGFLLPYLVRDPFV